MTPRCPVCRTDRFVDRAADDGGRAAHQCTCRRCGMVFEAGPEPLPALSRPR